nr:hypothetical protein [Pantoea sp. 18069]
MKKREQLCAHPVPAARSAFTKLRQHPLRPVCASQFFRTILHALDSHQQLLLALHQALLQQLDLSHLALQALQQGLVLPGRARVRQKATNLVEREAGALGARNDLQHPGRLRAVLAVAIFRAFEMDSQLRRVTTHRCRSSLPWPNLLSPGHGQHGAFNRIVRVILPASFPSMPQLPVSPRD